MAKKHVSYTQLTLAALKKQGLLCGIVEKWNRFAGVHGKRVDLFHFIDILAVGDAEGIIGVQSTGPSGHADHKRKIVEECGENAARWLRAGGRIQLWSSRKLLVKRGGKARRWQPRIEEITLECFK